MLYKNDQLASGWNKWGLANMLRRLWHKSKRLRKERWRWVAFRTLQNVKMYKRIPLVLPPKSTTKSVSALLIKYRRDRQDSMICHKGCLTSVPPVVTCGPGQGAYKGVKQVEDSPGQHHDVVDVQIDHDHLRRNPHSCRTQWMFLAAVFFYIM